MKMSLKVFLSALLFLSFGGRPAVFAQSDVRYPRSAILDEAAYASLPKKAPLANRSYEGLPKAFSLKQYAPLPGDQTDYGTCVAWASAYAARTISESFALGRRDQADSTRNAFSPVYVYRNIQPDDPECQRGAQIFWALDLMKETGAVKMIDVERTVDFPRVDLSLYRDSRRYPIADYVTLFDKDERYKPGLVTRIVKKSLSEGKPVIIGMNTPDSFLEAKDFWRPGENPEHYYGGHAMCVIGYDDERDGGAFEVINSWGRKWGNGGFIWIPYRAFVDFVMESYEMIENLAVYSDAVRFSGSLRIDVIEQSGGQTRTSQAALSPSPEGGYKTAASYAEGTAFSFSVGSGESAYLYAFAVSRSGRENEISLSPPVQIFPQAGTSALLNYRDSTVVLPGENKTLVLDEKPGAEYLVLLYAKEPLDMRDISRRFGEAAGTVKERLSSVLGRRLLLVSQADTASGGAAFSLEAKDSKAVAGLITAIDHR